ncbi:MAG TPA: porin family protein [Chryseosolibacter sp.]|nr:porin family protein [Chryseosolibacter sp.]
MRKVLLLMAVVMSAGMHVAHGQSTCAQTLRLAQSIYEQGRLHELPQLLDHCLSENGFNEEEKVSAYKLLTLTYIYLEEPVKADEMMLALLRTDTEFKVNDAVDPAEFVALYKTFRTYPIYRIGAKLGAIATAPSVVSADYADDGTNDGTHSFGFSGSVTAEIPLTGSFRNFTLQPEIAFQMVSFEGVNRWDENNGRGDTARVTPATETQSWISIPVSLQYNLFDTEKSHYYISAGISADYLLSASKRITSNIETNSGVDENSFSVKAQRNAFNAGALLSAGLKRKIGKGFLIAEIRYKLGLLPLSERADTYEHSILVFDYKYVDGIYKLNSLSLSVGYVINRYNPKKLSSR